MFELGLEGQDGLWPSQLGSRQVEGVAQRRQLPVLGGGCGTRARERGAGTLPGAALSARQRDQGVGSPFSSTLIGWALKEGFPCAAVRIAAALPLCPARGTVAADG